MSETYTGEDRRAQGWHLKKEVNLSIIISLIGVGMSCVAGYYDLKRDIETLKQDSAALHQMDNRIEIGTKESIKTLQEALLRMEVKLDRLIERKQ